jgi:Mg-chelatase subunit ChlD
VGRGLAPRSRAQRRCTTRTGRKGPTSIIIDEAASTRMKPPVTNDPIEFSLAFVAALRKRTDLSQPPSLRTALAIPRFLSARLFRKGSLTARDFVEAAVYITPFEDQGAAFDVAREIVFPREKLPLDDAASDKPEDDDLDAVVVKNADPPAGAANDNGPSLLDDLAGMDLGDLGSLDLAALDKALDAQTSAAVEMKSLDLLSEMAASNDDEDKSTAALVNLFGGPAELEAEGVRDREAVDDLLLDRLKGRAGALTPEEAFHAGVAGFDEELLGEDVDDTPGGEVTLPWEKAGLLAHKGKDAIAELLDGALNEGDAHELGRMLAFLAPHKKRLGKSHGAFQKRALASARHLSDWAEMLDGLGAFVQPPKDLLASSAQENLPRALAAAEELEKAFNKTLKPTVFEEWASAVTESPGLEFLLDCSVPCAKWDAMLDEAFQLEVREDLDEAAQLATTEARAERVRAALPKGRRLRDTKSPKGAALAGELSTLALVAIQDRSRFLPLMDALVDAKLMPSDNARVVAAGLALGIDEAEIWARLSAPLEQLRYLIEARVQDVQRHIDIVGKVDFVPEEMLKELVFRCLDEQYGPPFLLGIATLLAIALGPVSEMVPRELVEKALGYKGIGGGENLLVQWFEHRTTLHTDLRNRIKEIAKAALIDAAFAWVHKGTGSAEQGLVPQSRARPFRAGDEVDDLDLEATLDALVASGKSLDQMGDDDLFVTDKSSGRAGFGVLIDISGSMSGKDLAVCAIAVVMLLGKLKPEEIAIALFESNTHVVKRFHEKRDLDEVADTLLELNATGGTRVDQALRFIADEFDSETEHERRLLFLLSDFCFFEEERELMPLAQRIRDMDVGYLGASHGSVCQAPCNFLLRHLGGHSVKLSSMQKLPEVLLQALTVVGEGKLR